MSKKLELRSFKPELRTASETEPSKLVGYAATFNNPTSIGGLFTEVIAPGAFTDSIVQDNIVALVNHDQNLVLGRNVSGTLTLREDAKGLYFEIDLPATTTGKDIGVLVQRGDISECSFAFVAQDEAWDYETDTRTLNKVKLFDVSVVTDPAYNNTSVSARSAQEVLAEFRAQAKTKKVDGEELTADAFLIVGDKNDPETWKLPVKFSTDKKTKDHIRDAISRFDQLKDVSDADKKAAWDKLMDLAKEYDIDVQDTSERSKHVVGLDLSAITQYLDVLRAW
jgi:HK97 family phage prohead protease